MNGELRPLGTGEILDAGIKLFMRHWRTLVLSVVGLILPVQVLSALVTASIAPEQFDLTSTETGVSQGEEAEFLVGQGVIALLSVISILLATAVCFKAVADAYLGVEPEWRRSLRFAVRRLGGLLGVALVGGLLVALATLALILPGIWLFVMFSVAVPALLLERIGPVAALRRSYRLVRGRWWPTAGTLLVGYLLIGIIGAIVSGVIMVDPEPGRGGQHARRRARRGGGRDGRLRAHDAVLRGRGDAALLRPAGAQGGARPPADRRGHGRRARPRRAAPGAAGRRRVHAGGARAGAVLAAAAGLAPGAGAGAGR